VANDRYGLGAKSLACFSASAICAGVKCFGVAAVSGLAEQLDGFGRIRRTGFACEYEHGEIILRGGESVVGRFAEPSQRLAGKPDGNFTLPLTEHLSLINNPRNPLNQHPNPGTGHGLVWQRRRRLPQRPSAVIGLTPDTAAITLPLLSRCAHFAAQARSLLLHLNVHKNFGVPPGAVRRFRTGRLKIICESRARHATGFTIPARTTTKTP
jgi:hypothetical protein